MQFLTGTYLFVGMAWRHSITTAPRWVSAAAPPTAGCVAGRADTIAAIRRYTGRGRAAPVAILAPCSREQLRRVLTMIEPERSEREEAVTRTGPDGTGERTVTRTSSTVAPMGFRAKSTVWLAVGIVDVILALDFIFKLLASANVGFVGFISSVAGALAAPFQGVLATTATSGHYTYWPDVAGIVVYFIAAWIVVALIGIMAARRPPNSDRRQDGVA